MQYNLTNALKLYRIYFTNVEYIFLLRKGIQKMKKKLSDSELKVMQILWQHDEISAKEIAQIMKEQENWSKTTTYTCINRCVDKGAVEARKEPFFYCKAIVKKEEVQLSKTNELIDKVFNGSRAMLFSTLFNHEKMTQEEINYFKELINGKED